MRSFFRWVVVSWGLMLMGTACGPSSSMRCRADTDCQDGIFCNGQERCVTPEAPGADLRGCIASPLRCADGTFCSERLQACRPPCVTDSDCDDGRFCNGAELCRPGGPATDAIGCRNGAPACGTRDACVEGRTGMKSGSVVRLPPACLPTNCLLYSDGENAQRAWALFPDGGIVRNVVIADMDNDGRWSRSCGGDDCDDSNPNVNADLDEICDALDVDEDCNPCTVGSFSPKSRVVSGDDDRDGFFSVRCKNVISTASGPLECGLRGDRSETVRVRVLGTTTTVEGTDCNDLANDVNPLASESCNAVDDDCDGLVDETTTRAYFLDEDLDGHGAGAPVQLCPGVPGYSTLSNDCDDRNPAIKPGSLVCEPSPVASNTVKLCQSDGGFMSLACGGQGQCVPQPNGAGVCF